jgi:hypothetical protein
MEPEKRVVGFAAPEPAKSEEGASQVARLPADDQVPRQDSSIFRNLYIESDYKVRRHGTRAPVRGGINGAIRFARCLAPPKYI